MGLLETVKLRLGILYTDPLKDSEIQSIIDGAKEDMKLSGVESSQLESPLAVENIIIYAKMAQLNLATDFTLHPVYISNLVKLRGLESLENVNLP